MTVIAYTDVTIQTGSTSFDSTANTGDTIYVSSQAVLIANADPTFGNLYNAFSPFTTGITYHINGEVLGGFDAYSETFTMNIGPTGMYTVGSFFQMNTGVINNAGYMTAPGALVISKYDDISGSSLNDLVLSNSGTIQALSSNPYSGHAAIESSGTFTSIHNTGSILGIDRAIEVGTGPASITNTGLIRGDIDTGMSADSVLNGGSILGDVNLGDGDNAFVSTRDGFVSGSLTTGSGRDTITGGDNDETIETGTGNDYVRAGHGDDTVNAQNGNDTVLGQLGDDVIQGGAFFDVLYGGKGDDVVDGGKHNDTISGGQGNDTLTGGQNNDVFVFNPNNGHDIVTDFQNGFDVLDISHFGLTAADYGSIVEPAVTIASASSVLIDLEQLGGSGSVIVNGLSFANLDISDFVF